MRNVLVTNYEDFADVMMGFARDGNDVCCVTYEQNSYNLLRELLNHKEVIPCGMEIQCEEFSGYDKEYYIALTKDFLLFVEPAYHEKNEYHEAGYYEDESDMIFVDTDADENIFEYLFAEDNGIHKVEFRAVSNPMVYVDREDHSIEDYRGDCCMDCENCDKYNDGIVTESESKEDSVYELLYSIKALLDDYFD